MAINLLEQNLEAITQTLARLQKEGCNDEKILNELREERDKILKDLKLLSILTILLLNPFLRLNQL